MSTIDPGAMRPHPTNPTRPAVVINPQRWLLLGIQDYRRARKVGLAYGLMVTVLGWLIFALGNHPYFIAAAISGFFLMGPILGAGLIEASMTMEAGGTPTFDSSLRGLDRNGPALVRFGLALLGISIAWLVLSTSLLIIAMGPIAPPVQQTLWDSTLQLMSSRQLFAWFAIGGVLAVLTFSISVISVPLILDRQASAGEAMRGSLRAVSRHPLACVTWGFLIVLLSAIGFATALIGLIVIYPILGHASWHAYRALQD